MTRLAILAAVSVALALPALGTQPPRANAALTPLIFQLAGIVYAGDLDDATPPPYPPGQEVPEHFPDAWENEGMVLRDDDDIWISEKGEYGYPIWKKQGQKFMWQGHPVWVLRTVSADVVAAVPEPPAWAGYEDLFSEDCAWLEFCSQHGLCS